MLYVKIAGLHTALDGEYPLDASSLKNSELRRIKLMAGVRVLELSEAFAAGDNDVLVAFAAIALARAGKQFTEDALWDAEGGKITFEEREEAGADASPPDQPNSESAGASSEPSGLSSSNGSELSPETLSRNLSGVSL